MQLFGLSGKGDILLHGGVTLDILGGFGLSQTQLLLMIACDYVRQVAAYWLGGRILSGVAHRGYVVSPQTELRQKLLL